MPLVVSTVLNHARDLHPALAPENAPVPVALRALSRIQRDLVDQITRRVPSYLERELAIDMSTVDFDAGVDLQAAIGNWLDLTEGNVTYANTPSPARTAPANNVPWLQRDMAPGFPSYSIRDNVLFFLGQASDWSQVATFTLGYTPLPDDLTTPASEFLLREDAREALAAGLAREWIGRLVGNPLYGITADTAQYWEARAAGEKSTYLSSIFRMNQRQRWQVRDVGPRGYSAG